MAYLFSYGTLREKRIQKELLFRELEGWPDRLQGFKLSKKKAYGQYPVISRTTDLSSSVSGMVFKIAYDELYQIDAYEGEEYVRIIAKLQSGKEAWVYVAK